MPYLILSLSFLAVTLILGHRAVSLTPIYLTTSIDQLAEADAARCEHAFWVFWVLTLLSACLIR